MCVICESESHEGNNWRFAFNNANTSTIRCCEKHSEVFVCSDCEGNLHLCRCGTWMLCREGAIQCQYEYDDHEDVWQCSERICMDCANINQGMCYGHK